MIDPLSRDMGLSDEGSMQQFLLFTVAVAGKESTRAEAAVGKFMRNLLRHASLLFTLRNTWRRVNKRPLMALDLIASVNDAALDHALRSAKIGQYARITKAYRTLADRFKDRDPRTLTVEELESVPGIGPKTARYFVQYTQGRKDVAAIDTHLLKFLRDQGYEGIPKSTPPAGETYRRCERLFLEQAAFRGVDPVDLDFYVWKTYRDGKRIIGFGTFTAEEVADLYPLFEKIGGGA